MVPASPKPSLAESENLKYEKMTEASWDKIDSDASVDALECKAFISHYYPADDVAQLHVSVQYDVGCLATYRPQKDCGLDVSHPDASNKGRSCPNGSEKSSGGKNVSGNNSSGQESHGGDNTGQQPSGSNGRGLGAGGDGNGDDPNGWQKPLPKDADDFDIEENNSNDKAEEVPTGSSSQSIHGRANAKRSINAVKPSVCLFELQSKQPHSNCVDVPADDRNGTNTRSARAAGLSVIIGGNDIPGSSTSRSPRSPSNVHPESYPLNSPVQEPIPTEPDPFPLPAQSNEPGHGKVKATVSKPLSKDNQPGTSAGGGQHSTIDCFIDSSSAEKEVANEEDQMREYQLNRIPPPVSEMHRIRKPSNDDRTHDESQPGSELDFLELPSSELRRSHSTSSSDESNEANISFVARMNAVGNRRHDAVPSSDDEMEDGYGNNVGTNDQNGHWDPGKRSSSANELSGENDEDMDCNLDRPGTSGLQACMQSQIWSGLIQTYLEDAPRHPTISVSPATTTGIPGPSLRLQLVRLDDRISSVSTQTINDPSWHQLVDNQPPPPRRMARHCDSCDEDIVTDLGEFGISGTFTCGRCVEDERNEVRVDMMRERPRRDRVFYDPPPFLFEPGPANRAFIQRHVDRRVRRSCNFCPTEVWTSDPLYCPSCGKFFCHPACLDQHICRHRTFRDDDD